MNPNKKRILWITRTAMFIALLIVVQFATKSIGMPTLVTGSLVNLILIASVMTCGFSSGLTVAVISPVFAMLLGIGSIWILIPFIALGNFILILLWYVLGKRVFKDKLVGYFVALVAGAACKFLVLYLSIVQILIPLLNLPEKQAAVISATFSFPQLFTALIGGAIAIMLLPIIKKATAARQV